MAEFKAPLHVASESESLAAKTEMADVWVTALSQPQLSAYFWEAIRRFFSLEKEQEASPWQSWRALLSISSPIREGERPTNRRL